MALSAQSLAYLREQVRLKPELVWPRLTKYIPHAPTPKQAAFLLLPHLEAFYGGAASGGKSDGLLMAGLQYVDVPRYAALILRRTFKDLALPGALMDRAFEWLRPSDAQWDDTETTWRFPSGATLTFGYLASENDKYRYQSSEFQYIAFDELTGFSETQYRYLFSRLRRRAGVNVPLRMRSASNPGGIGHDWVQRYFNIHTDPITGILRGGLNGRLFIPALKSDNPHIDQASYTESLSRLDPITRAQLAEGDWSARQSGGKFKREWFEIVDAIPAELTAARWWDTAGTLPKPGKDPDWTRGVKAGYRAGVTYIIDIQSTRDTPGQVEKLVKQTAQLDGISVTQYMGQEPGDAGIKMIDDYRLLLMGYVFIGVRETGPKELYINPVSSQAEAGNIKLLRGTWNAAFLDEAETYGLSGQHDDQLDALGKLCNKLWLANDASVETVESYEYTISGASDY